NKVSIASKVFNSMGQGVLVTDEHGKITDINPRFTEITGYTEEEVRGENPNILQSGEQDRTFYTNMWDMLRQEGIWQGEIINNKKKNVEMNKQWLNIKKVRIKEGDIERYVGTFSEMD